MSISMVLHSLVPFVSSIRISCLPLVFSLSSFIVFACTVLCLVPHGFFRFFAPPIPFDIPSHFYSTLTCSTSGLSRNAIFANVEASLKRLDTPYLDLLQIHRFDEDVPIEETMEALHDLVKSGKVRYIGASSMWAYQFAQMQFVAEKHNWTKFISMQNHYNLLYREEEREMNQFCNETGVGLIPVRAAISLSHNQSVPPLQSRVVSG